MTPAARATLLRASEDRLSLPDCCTPEAEELAALGLVDLDALTEDGNWDVLTAAGVAERARLG